MNSVSIKQCSWILRLLEHLLVLQFFLTHDQITHPGCLWTIKLNNNMNEGMDQEDVWHVQRGTITIIIFV